MTKTISSKPSSWIYSKNRRANSLATVVNMAGACEAPKGKPLKRAMCPFFRRNAM